MVKVRQAKSPVFTDPRAWNLPLPREALERFHMNAEVDRGLLRAEESLELGSFLFAH